MRIWISATYGREIRRSVKPRLGFFCFALCRLDSAFSGPLARFCSSEAPQAASCGSTWPQPSPKTPCCSAGTSPNSFCGLSGPRLFSGFGSHVFEGLRCWLSGHLVVRGGSWFSLSMCWCSHTHSRALMWLLGVFQQPSDARRVARGAQAGGPCGPWTPDRMLA